MLGVDIIPEILTDERFERPFAHLVKLDAILSASPWNYPGPPSAWSASPNPCSPFCTVQAMLLRCTNFVDHSKVIATCRHITGIVIDDPSIFRQLTSL